MAPGDSSEYDVIIVGGALSGASTATLLKRRHPELRVLIVEKSERFSRRVGEATVEVSAFFLGRVMGLTQYLNEAHLVKQGLRFWFQNESVQNLEDASEIGGKYQVRLPSYQLDRATLDEEVLRRACALGADLLRPATAAGIELEAGGLQTVMVRLGDETRTLRARWVVDASGIASVLARKQGWRRQNLEHPTAAAWARWKGVKDWDGIELAARYPEWASCVGSIRGTATNHLMGDGWWAWFIPLKGGDVSAGVVFDQRLVQWPQDGGSLGMRLKAFLMRHPVGREMLANAEVIEEDVHWRKNLAYHSTTVAGDGFVLVGDAAVFLDPFYSPGMDWIAFTAASAADLVRTQREGEPLAERIEKLNHDVALSYHSWFEAVYKDKYEYLNEWDLMRLAFRLDLGLYYLGIVSQPFRDGAQALLMLPFTNRPSRFVFRLMRLYNRRFAAIARRRRAFNAMGRMNCGKRSLIPGFTLSRSDARRLIPLLGQWAWLEVTEGWRSWGANGHAADAPRAGGSMPTDPAAAKL